jgi:outer membrane lipoprotein SlyB
MEALTAAPWLVTAMIPGAKYLRRREIIEHRLGVRHTTARRREMKTIITASAIFGALMLAAPAANAKGCVKGAVVGGVAGHYVGSGHGVLGAAAGCLVGRHYGKKHAREQQIRQNTGRKY